MKKIKKIKQRCEARPLPIITIYHIWYITLLYYHITLFIITGASLLTWLPFQILNLSASLHMNANIPHMQLMTLIVKALQYSNSFVNVIIYPLRIPEFKNCLPHLLRCCVVPSQVFNSINRVWVSCVLSKIYKYAALITDL